MRLRIILLSLFLLFLADKASSQLSEDLGVWASLTYNLDITDDLELGIDEEFRVNSNFGKLDTYFTNVALKYKINKNLRVAGGYRWINKMSDSGFWGTRHRLLADVYLRGRINRYQFQLRNRAQREDRGYGSFDEYGKATKWHLRQTFTISYQLNQRLEPYFYIDFREVLHNPREINFVGFDRHRIRFGIDIDVNRTQTLGVFLMQSQHWNIEEPERIFVIGLEYTFGNAVPLFAPYD